MNQAFILRVFLLGSMFMTFHAPAQAQWLHHHNESAFGDQDLHLAVTAIHNYGFGLRCRGDTIEAIYMTPDTSFDTTSLAIANATKPKLRIRVDNQNVIDLIAELSDNDGKATAIAVTDVHLLLSVRDAKNRVAVALELLGENYHENSFNVRGSTTALKKVISGCALEMPIQ